MTTPTLRRTTKSAMTTRRGNFSTASSVLLLCAALLLTKSCGIFAQADPWSETTTQREGSGWEVTEISTNQPDTTDNIEPVDTTTLTVETPTEETTVETTLETTGQPSEQQPTSGPSEEQSTSGPSEEQPTTSGPSEEQPTTVNPSEEQPTTVSPSEEQPTTVNPSEEQPTTVSPSEEQPTTVSPSEEQPTTVSPSEEQPTTTSPNEEQPTTTTEAATTIAPTPPAPPVFECPSTGLFPHIGDDCQRFYNCLLDAVTGKPQPLEMVCPPQTVFAPSYVRCVHDLAECASDIFVCPRAGRFAGLDDRHYYNCVASLRGGLHKYIVRCSVGQRFEPLLGRCWRYDWTQVLPGQALETSDLAAIKREQKELKAEEKLRKKAEKQKEKEALKQQKLEEKLAKKAAKKAAKEQAKANKPISVESAESAEQPSVSSEN